MNEGEFLSSTQLTFSFQGSSALSPKVEAAMEELALRDDVDSRGAVFTRREVVDFILDLTGYTADQPLPHWRLLEPSFGAGDFLFPAIERLMSAWREEKAEGTVFEDLKNSIRAVELHHHTFSRRVRRSSSFWFGKVSISVPRGLWRIAG